MAISTSHIHCNTNKTITSRQNINNTCEWATCHVKIFTNKYWSSKQTHCSNFDGIRGKLWARQNIKLLFQWKTAQSKNQQVKILQKWTANRPQLTNNLRGHETITNMKNKSLWLPFSLDCPRLSSFLVSKTRSFAVLISVQLEPSTQYARHMRPDLLQDMWPVGATECRFDVTQQRSQRRLELVILGNCFVRQGNRWQEGRPLIDANLADSRRQHGAHVAENGGLFQRPREWSLEQTAEVKEDIGTSDNNQRLRSVKGADVC